MKKIKTIISHNETLVVLCEDNSIYQFTNGMWSMIPEIHDTIELEKIDDQYNYDELIKIKISNLDLNSRAYNCLMNENIETVAEIVGYGLFSLSFIPDAGLGTLKNIYDALKKINIKVLTTHDKYLCLKISQKKELILPLKDKPSHSFKRKDIENIVDKE